VARTIAYTVEFVDIAHREEYMHDRIPNRHARRVSGPQAYRTICCDQHVYDPLDCGEVYVKQGHRRRSHALGDAA
jgi:hypothetical protein